MTPMHHPLRRRLLLALALAGMLHSAAAQVAPDTPATRAAPATRAEPPALQPELVTLQVQGGGGFGGDAPMVLQIFKPEGKPGPFPVVVYSHGRAADRVDRVKLTYPIPHGHVRYWTAKGFAVVAPIRPGYGASGGTDREQSGGSFDTNGQCNGKPDFLTSTRNASQAVRTALDWVREQPWARKDRLLLEGQSVGGLTTVALAADNPPGVVGYINFSGGAGGNPDRAPGKSCAPEVMAELMAAWGKTTQVPNLWLYAENDLFWGPEVPKLWHAAFAGAMAEPMRSQLVQTAPVPNSDGHQLMYRGGSLWSVHTNRFVKQLGF